MYSSPLQLLLLMLQLFQLLTVGASSSGLLSPFDMTQESLIIFFISGMTSARGTSSAFPAPDLELGISSGSTVSFQWEVVFRGYNQGDRNHLY